MGPIALSAGWLNWVVEKYTPSEEGMTRISGAQCFKALTKWLAEGVFQKYSEEEDGSGFDTVYKVRKQGKRKEGLLWGVEGPTITYKVAAPGSLEQPRWILDLPAFINTAGVDLRFEENRTLGHYWST